MTLEGIISIAGRPGLFKVITKGKNSVIVESLIDKKRFAALAKVEKRHAEAYQQKLDELTKGAE